MNILQIPQPSEEKPFGVPLPDHWQRKRLRYLSSRPIRNGLGEAANSDDSEHPRYIRITDIAGPRQLRPDTFRSLPPEVAMDAMIYENDILISVAGSTGKSFYVRGLVGEACFAGYLVRLSPIPEVDSSFLAYWTESRDYWAQIDANVIQSTIQNFSANKVRHLNAPIPPLNTQRRIARFLDEKTAKIDGLIKKKRDLLKHLAEKRQALITHVVTKGLDALTKDVSLKPEKRAHTKNTSIKGVDNINYFPCSNKLSERMGQISANWERNWLKWSVDLSTKRPTEEEQKTLPYISNENIASWTGELLIKEPQLAGTDSRKFQKYDVLFNNLRPYLAKVYYATFDGVSSGELLCLRPTHAVESRFLFYVLVSKKFIDKVSAETFGSKMPRANWEIVGHQPLPLPPLDIQRQIALFLDEKTTQINGLNKLIVQSIDKFMEYRSALITCAVIGQLAESI